MTPEKKIQNEIINYFKEYKNIYVERRQAMGIAYRKGSADIFVVIEGFHIEIEIKAENGEPSSLQLKWEDRCKNLWHIPYFRVKSLKEIKEIMERLFPHIFKI